MTDREFEAMFEGIAPERAEAHKRGLHGIWAPRACPHCHPTDMFA